jgi:hypothetical protein
MTGVRLKIQRCSCAADTQAPRGHRVRQNHRRVCDCRAGVDDVYKKLVKGQGEATFAPLDPESAGGVGGVSEEVFGQLVRAHPSYCLHMFCLMKIDRHSMTCSVLL